MTIRDTTPDDLWPAVLEKLRFYDATGYLRQFVIRALAAERASHVAAEQRLALMDAKLARFEQASVVLREIAYARPETWDDPSDFRAWAQNRGRWVLDKLAEGGP